jgi:hypothetical protein
MPVASLWDSFGIVDSDWSSPDVILLRRMDPQIPQGEEAGGRTRKSLVVTSQMPHSFLCDTKTRSRVKILGSPCGDGILKKRGEWRSSRTCTPLNSWKYVRSSVDVPISEDLGVRDKQSHGDEAEYSQRIICLETTLDKRKPSDDALRRL